MSTINTSQRDGDRHCFHVGVELGRDRAEHEHHQEEIERIESPAEVARDERVSLLAVECLPLAQDAHSHSSNGDSGLSKLQAHGVSSELGASVLCNQLPCVHDQLAQ
jgi:hypothetical protein